MDDTDMTGATPTLADLDWPRRTDRLVLRPARLDDADAVWRFRSRPDVAEWLSRHLTRDRFEEQWQAGLGQEVVALLQGAVIGTGRVHVEDGWAQDEAAEAARGVQAEIGWILDPGVQGRGLGTELARALLDVAWDLGMRRVVAYAFADNVASVRIMEKIGMRREGLYRRESLHRTRGWLDGVAYAVLRDEVRAD